MLSFHVFFQAAIKNKGLQGEFYWRLGRIGWILLLVAGENWTGRKISESPVYSNVDDKRVLNKILGLGISKQNVESSNLLSLIKIGGMRYNNFSFSFNWNKEEVQRSQDSFHSNIKLFIILSFLKLNNSQNNKWPEGKDPEFLSVKYGVWVRVMS